MHGGLISSVIDTATTTVLRTMGRKVPGVSIELSVRYEITNAFSRLDRFGIRILTVEMTGLEALEGFLSQ